MQKGKTYTVAVTMAKKEEIERKAEEARLAKITEEKAKKVEVARLAKVEEEKVKEEADKVKKEAELAKQAQDAKITKAAANKAKQEEIDRIAAEEAMRRIGINVPTWTCNTRQYLSYLGSHGWVKSYDIRKLRPGSICFTTNTGAGYPTHTFAFMGWVNSGNYTLAYVADNQGYTVHVRNMGATEATDAFAYFMHN